MRAAATIAQDGDILIIGSQAILGSYDADQLPVEATMSVEADVAFWDDPDDVKADPVDGGVGEGYDRHMSYPARYLLERRHAVAFVLGISIAFASCGSTGTRVSTSASTSLFGLEVTSTASVAYVHLPTGVGVIDGVRKGHPAIFVSDAEGVGKWITDDSAEMLTDLRAWVDGDLVRVIGHTCKSWGTDAYKARYVETSDTGDEGCWDQGLSALAFSISSGKWVSTKAPASFDGKRIHTVSTSGKKALASVDMTHMELLDMKSGLSKKISMPFGAASAIECGSKGTFLAVPTITTAPGQPSQIAGEQAPRDQVAVLHDDTWNMVPLPPMVSGDLVAASGCVNGKLLITVTDISSKATKAYLIDQGADSRSIEAKLVPSPSMKGFPIAYSPDIGQTAVVAADMTPHKGEEHRVSVWDPTNSVWSGLTGQFSPEDTFLVVSEKVLIGVTTVSEHQTLRRLPTT